MSYLILKPNRETDIVKTLKEVKEIVKGLYPEPNIKRYGLLPTINTTGHAYYYKTNNLKDYEIIMAVTRWVT